MQSVQLQAKSYSQPGLHTHSLNSIKREEEKEQEIRIEKMSKLYTMNWVSFLERFKKVKPAVIK